VQHIVWKSWGGPKALGTGVSDYVAPNQDVAEGTEEPAAIVAFDRGACYGKFMYQAIEWYFPQHGQTFNPDQYQNICIGGYVTSATTATTCVPGHIKAGNGPEISPATGEAALIITLSNTGRGSCKLDGYPRVRLVTSAGVVLRLPQVTRSQYIIATRPHPVMLAVGAFAYVAIAKYRCDLGDLQVASQLQLTLPGAAAGPVFTVPVVGATGTMSFCKGGSTDPGNVIAVTPVESTLAGTVP